MKLILSRNNDEDLQKSFERILDVLSIALNRGLTESIIRDLSKEDHEQRSHLWMYQKNGGASTFKNCDRVDLMPCMNDYWIYFERKTKASIIFELKFRYSDPTFFRKILTYLFDDLKTLAL
jgi:hypothetical protein